MTAHLTESARFLLADEELLRKALTIRRTEEKLLQLCAEGAVRGTVHTAIGQELPALAVIGALGADDWIFSNHRGHAHFLARTDDVEGLVAELLGRVTGVCGGLGGSQHLHAKRFLSNGIVGGLAPVAAGTALASQLAGVDAISVLFVGDGAFGAGVVYEALNIAACWNLSVLIVVENNGYAQSTPTSAALAGTIRSRAEAFDIEYRASDSWNLPDLFLAAREAVARCRSGRPTLLEVQTYRLSAHSKGDDHRPRGEIDSYRARDVLTHVLSAKSALVDALERSVSDRVDVAVRHAKEAAYPLPNFARSTTSPVVWTEMPPVSDLGADSIYRFLHDTLASNDAAVLIGEDIGAPYGGAFRITRDLSDRFPARVRSTPISEAAIVGTGCGIALAGGYPIVEIMFGDFLPLAFDQILNHAAKFSYLSRGAAKVPLIVRTPMGGRRGYGATHSQSLEKHFMGISGIRIVALNSVITPHTLYSDVLTHLDQPCIVIEHKSLYTRRAGPESVPGFAWAMTQGPFPVVRLSPTAATASVTVVCYGQMLDEVTQAMLLAFQEAEVVSEAYCLSLISPLQVDALFDSVNRTQTLVCVEEGSAEAGFGSEVVAQLVERGVSLRRVRRLGATGIVPAAGPLEAETIPDSRMVCEAIKEICG